ncbi:MAG: hypothetical protein HYW49_08240 [Deltaproteobacteria bacterium]|nr:hypothetical protein [Deltaproteobacteria bacterium]
MSRGDVGRASYGGVSRAKFDRAAFAITASLLVSSGLAFAGDTVDDLNTLVKKTGAPTGGPCGAAGCATESPFAAFCAKPFGTACSGNPSGEQYEKIQAFKKNCLKDVMKDLPPLPPKPIPDKRGPDLIPPENLDEIRAWQKKFDRYQGKLLSAILPGKTVDAVNGLFEEVRSHMLHAVDAQKGLAAQTKTYMKGKVADTTIVSPLEYLNAFTTDVTELAHYNEFMKHCGPDGLSTNAFNIRFNGADHVVVCPGYFIDALKDVTHCGEEKPKIGDGPKTKDFQISPLPVDKLRVEKQGYLKMRILIDKTPDDTLIDYDALVRVFGHEIGHSIDAAGYGPTDEKTGKKPLVLETGFEKYAACIQKKHPTLKPPLEYLNEISADYWSAEAMAKYNETAYSFALQFNSLSPKDALRIIKSQMSGLCGSTQGDRHPDGATRIRSIYGMNSSLRESLRCPSMPSKQTTCTFEGEVPVK